ncbi:MAG: chromosome segregation protein SMC [Oscillospiraceae bacterium]|jgi:chromosome segregation protein|nr:chromosome segregation protein SMC [Oscillospiraceae bacterium]
MHLKALELHGFKSFPDKTRLEFGSGITCVVGPNGSGKSNVSDAVRWVLGEQSTKNLRGSKMEDVIFSGTGQRKQLGLAEVTLHLDNRDRQLNQCEQDDVSVTRRLYRSGESDYLINGKNCRLRDVHELFMDTGLGRDGYSLVGQGRVADLISSRSEQRRDMLEEAAGISQSRYRRAAAMHKLGQAEENLLRLRDILLELEGRLEPLKAQKEKAEQFLTLAQQRKLLEIGLALHTITQSVELLREQEHKLTKSRAEYDLAVSELAQLEAEAEQLYAQSQELTVRAEALRSARASLEEQALRRTSEIAVLENTAQHNEAAIARLTQDRVHANASQQELAQTIAALEEALAALREQAAEKQEELDTAARQIAKTRESDEALAQRTGALTQELTILAQRLSQMQIAQSAAQSSEQELRQRMEAIAQSDCARQGQAQALEEELCRAQETLQQNRLQAEEHNNALQGYTLRAKSRESKALDARKTLEGTQAQLRQKQGRMRLLEDLEQNMEGYAGAVRTVMRETRHGALRGIHGTLSQLIKAEPEYAAAVETALGAALQFVVCDTEAEAKRAIELLQRSKAGRATFLPLNAIRAQEFRETGLERCAGFVAMADTLLRFDAQYSQIIKAQLGRTVVVRDMDAAIAIAKRYQQRLRIVTLDGQQVNPGGSMTGGSRGQGAGILSRQNEIAQLGQECLALQAKLETETVRSKQLGEEAAAAQAACAGLQGDLSRALEEVIRQESRVHSLELRLRDMRAGQEELALEKTACAHRLLQLQEDQAAGGERAALLEQEQAQRQAELEALALERTALAEEHAQGLQTETGLRMALLALEKDADARREQMQTLQAHKEGHLGKDLELLEEQESLRGRNGEIAAQIAALQAEIARLHEQSAADKDEMEALLARRQDAQAKNETLRREEKLLSAGKERLGGELARLEERRSAARQAMESAAAKLYQDYQLSPREAEQMGCRPENAMRAQLELQEVNGKIRALGNINVDAIEEYREVRERHGFLSGQVSDIEQSREELLRLIRELTEKMAERFQAQFERINRFFGETFAELFNGGLAELRLENPADILESAIEIRVQPPGKNVQNIDLLSGGEKGLAAIALLFAILKANPAPFCIFDEVEAALDDVNVTRYARYVRRMTKNTQFILISHRRGTMEEADVLYGVTMQEEGVSKLLEMRTKEMTGKLGIA